MSTATLDRPATQAGPDTRPPFTRLVLVELRKMTDTRAGFWLLFTIAAVTVLVTVLILALGDAGDRDLLNVMEGAIQPAVIVLPVVGILLITSEWSQRTHLTTFALVPDRMRVIAAKAGAGLVLSVIAAAVAAAVAAAGVLVSGGDFDLPATLLGQHLVYVVTAMLMGIAFGAVLLASAPAIVIYFVLPTVFAALGSISFLQDAADWLDTSQTLVPLAEGNLAGEQWAQAGTSLVLWLALPLAVGLWRIRRSEIT